MSTALFDNAMSLRKKARLEKKKQKLSALVMISDLNDKERKRKHINEDQCPNNDVKKPKYQGNQENSKSPGKKERLAEGSQELAELRQKLRAKKRLLTSIPRLHVNTVGDEAVFKPGANQQIPLFLSDIQDLITFSLTNNTFHHPRWCRIEKVGRISHVAVLVVEGVSSYTYSSEESNLPTLSGSDAVLEVIMPSAYGGDLAEELSHVPIPTKQRRKLLETHESVDEVLQNNSHYRYKMLRSMFPIKDSIENDSNLPTGDRFSRTELILSLPQLIEEKYPVQVNEEDKIRYKDYIFSKEEYKWCTSHSPLFAVDCEMCLTDAGMELTRVSVVDESFAVVYNSFVKPDLPIKDYITRYSGVTAKLMEGVETRLSDVQKALKALLPADAILVGQSLNCDLNALKMMHPYVIDTSVIYNITGNRGRKSKLMTLAREFLNERIQEGESHCSIEDSTACIKLVKLKLKKSHDFGDAVLTGRDEAVMHQAAATETEVEESCENKKPLTCPQITQGLVYSGLEAGFKMTVAGDHSVVEKYSMGCSAVKNQESKLTKIGVKDSDVAIELAVEQVLHHNATLIHVSTPQNVNDIEKWTLKIWNKLPPCGMLIVVLGGSSKPISGLCLVRINKNIPI